MKKKLSHQFFPVLILLSLLLTSTHACDARAQPFCFALSEKEIGVVLSYAGVSYSYLGEELSDAAQIIRKIYHYVPTQRLSSLCRHISQEYKIVRTDELLEILGQAYTLSYDKKVPLELVKQLKNVMLLLCNDKLGIVVTKGITKNKKTSQQQLFYSMRVQGIPIILKKDNKSDYASIMPSNPQMANNMMITCNMVIGNLLINHDTPSHYEGTPPYDGNHCTLEESVTDAFISCNEQGIDTCQEDQDDYADKENTFVGKGAGSFTTTATCNTGVGSNALQLNQFNCSGAGDNSVVGGNENTVIGCNALMNNISGSRNIAFGCNAGETLTIGNDNVYIASNADSEGESGTMRIGSNSQTRCFMAGVHGVTTDSVNRASVCIDDSGQLGTIPSEEEYKSASESSRKIKKLENQMKKLLARVAALEVRKK